MLRRPLTHIEDVVFTVVDNTIAKHGDKTRKKNPSFEAPTRPFLRMTRADTIKCYNEHWVLNKGKLFIFVEDNTKPEREVTDMIGLPVFMTHFLAEMKAFNMRCIAEDRTRTESVDLAQRRRDCRLVEESRRRLRRADRGVQGEQARPDAAQLVHRPTQVRDVPARRVRTRDGALCRVAPGRGPHPHRLPLPALHRPPPAVIVFSEMK